MEMSAPRWPRLLILAAFLLLSGLLVSPSLGDLGGDSAQYLSLAEQLAAGNGYVDAHLPGAPIHGHYPPGFPLLLVPVVWIFGNGPFLAAKLLLILLACLGLFFAERVVRRRLGQRSALLVLAICATGTALLLQSVRIQSEVPYFLCLFLFLDRLDRADGRVSPSALLFAVLAFSVRTAGLAALLVCATLVLGRRRNLRSFAAAGLCLVPVFLWFVFGRLYASGTWTYDQELLSRVGGFAGLPLHLLGGLGFGVRASGDLLLDHGLLSQQASIAYGIGGLTLIGLVTRLRHSRGAPEWLLSYSFLLAALAPERTVRYLVPVLPLLALSFLEGCRLVFRTVNSLLARSRLESSPSPSPSSGGRALLLSGVILALLHLAMTVPLLDARHRPVIVDAPPLERRQLASIDLREFEEGLFLPPGAAGARLARTYGDFLLLLTAARKRLPSDAILAHRKPRLVAYWTGRRCVPMPDRMEPEALRAALAEHGVTHVLADGLFLSTRRILAKTKNALGLEPVTRIRSSAVLAVPTRSEPPR